MPICRYFLVSGRQDLNLRPPGPQPEGWGSARLRRPGFIGFSASGCCPVLLSLFPVLFPGHMFVWVCEPTSDRVLTATRAHDTTATGSQPAALCDPILSC